MRITAKPKLCLLYFDFIIGESKFDVEIKQSIGENSVEVSVVNEMGDPVTDEKLIKIIRDYSIEKYSISYDSEDHPESSAINVVSPGVRLDPPI